MAVTKSWELRVVTTLRMPKTSLTQVNDLPDSNSVTFQIATGIRG